MRPNSISLKHKGDHYFKPYGEKNEVGLMSHERTLNFGADGMNLY